MTEEHPTPELILPAGNLKTIGQDPERAARDLPHWSIESGGQRYFARSFSGWNISIFSGRRNTRLSTLGQLILRGVVHKGPVS